MVFSIFLLFSAFIVASESVTQCYHCNSPYCGDYYDSRLGAVSSCSDLYQNTFGKLVAPSNNEQDDVEIVATLRKNNDISAKFLKIPMKIWEFFNKNQNDHTPRPQRFGQLTMTQNSSIELQDDVETVTTTSEVNGTNARFLDIPRKIWELFNKGEIDQNTQFVCVKANYYSKGSCTSLSLFVLSKSLLGDHGQVSTYRGCVPKYTRSISTACDFVNQKVVGASKSTVHSCSTCDTNLCNSSTTMSVSMMLSTLTIFLISLII
ncbi:hypothetical protein ABEB36_006383 [Hypothenemus hampei]|uniref:Protein sleepless n=1 Tax=Hypothenemus hampei TaxID=57062 RepID=A0ABD1EQC4_HYPHA